MRHKEFKGKAQIVIIDDDLDIQDLLRQFFTTQGFTCHTYGDAQEALEDLTQDRIQCDVIITDLILPGISGIQFTQRMKALGSLIPIILITAHKKVEIAAEAIRTGAYDFVVKPIHFPQLLLSVERALYLNDMKEQNKTLKIAVQLQSGSTNFEGVVGKSHAIKIVLDLALRAAKTSAPVLISGENGTGKEMIAKAIHARRAYKKSAFTVVNCSSIPDNLLELELFGHAQGYLRKTAEKKAGLFEETEDGIVFLDEVADLSLQLQSKLMRVLLEKKVKRLGEDQFRPVKVRFIAATTKNLREEIQKKKFREDLFFQLNVIPIRIPPLRERREDILPLADFFLRKYSALNNQPVKPFAKNSLDYMLNADWPRNVRELENSIERAVVLSDANTIEIEDILKRQNQQNETQEPTGFHFAIGHETVVPTVDQIINKYIVHVLKLNHGVKEKTAKDLQIDRKTLYRRLREIGIKSD